MIEGIFRKAGYIEPKEIEKIKFPLKIFWKVGNRINFLVIPAKFIFLLEIIRNLQRYVNLHGVIRGKRYISLERFSFERKDIFEVIAWIGKEVLLEAREIFNNNLKSTVILGSIYYDVFLQDIEKIYLVVDSEETFESIFDHILNSKKIILVDIQRNIEKALEFIRERGFSSAVFVDKMLLKEGKCIVLENRGKKKVRPLSEVL